MQTRHSFAACACACAVAVFLPRLQGASRSEARVPAPEPDRIVTLWANDDLRSSFDFRNGREGGRIVDGEIRLEAAQLVFDVFQEDHFTFGFTRDERVDLIDLGAAYVPPFDKATDRAPEFAVSIFHSLHLDGSQLSYVEPNGRVVRLKDAGRIQGLLPSQGLHQLEPKVGHTYVLRAELEGVGKSEMLFKLHVVDHRPGRSVTFRWGRLQRF